jgi:2-keto-4-pentenoate hydratase/2-oxohepta-3-ene-1,7-dioic acid hydratase in catechol pathway
MKIARYKKGRGVKWGVVESETIREMKGSPFEKVEVTSITHRLDEVRLLAPCLPSKIVAIGLNYRDHAEEVKIEIPKAPVLFIKPSTSVIGPDDSIIFPKMSRRVDYEAELGVVIKKKTEAVPEDRATDYVLGYTCFNDVTARDLQPKEGQWTLSKSFNTFSPMGPWIVTDIDPSHLEVSSYLNGERKQHSHTGNLIFDVRKLVSYISHVMTLLPGDVIATGTPSGIGRMAIGDRIDIVIEGIGTLSNTVAAQP